MNKQSKIYEVEDVSAKIKSAKAVALADFRGITVAQMTLLRDKIRQAGGQLQVIKNTLLARALKQNNYEIDKDKLFGTNITLFANQDEMAPLKVLAAFSKTTSLLPFKIGFMAGKIFSADEMSKFASLMSKIELQTKLVGMLASQPRRLVYSLNYNIQKLVLTLNGIKTGKQA